MPVPASRLRRQLASFADSAASPAAVSATAATIRRLSARDWQDVLSEEYHIHELGFTHAQGDLTLVITGGHSDATTVWRCDNKVAVFVHSGNLDRSLPGWRDRILRLNPPRQEGHFPIAELCPGTPRVFCQLIEAAQASAMGDNDFKIKEKLSLKEVRDIAKLSHQYEALHLIARNVPTWVDRLVPKVWKPKNVPDTASDHLELLWISYEFGLESLFKQVCFDLAYASDPIFGNPSALPPGTYDRVYSCRKAYMISLLSEVKTYVEDLREAVKPESYVGIAICKDPSDNKKCAALQLEVLKDWLKDEKIEIDGKVNLWDSDNRSPLHFFSAPPYITNNLWYFHRADRRGCGLGELADEIGRDPKDRLMLWLIDSGDEASPVGEEHLKYMAKQKQKIRW